MNETLQIYLQFLRDMVSDLPGASEKLCYGTPAFYAGKKIFARIKEDGETLVVHSTERDHWMNTDPETFFITDHYLNYDYMLVNLEKVDPNLLKTLLVTAWTNRAGKNQIREYQQKSD